MNWVYSNQLVNFSVSEWLLFNANSVIFSDISWREYVNFQWDDDRPTRSDGLIVLVHWNYSPRTEMSSHSDTLSCFPLNQSLFFPLNVVGLAKRKQIQILYSLTGARSPDVPVASTLTITSLIRFILVWYIAPIRYHGTDPVNNNVTYCIYYTITVCLENNLRNHGDYKDLIKKNFFFNWVTI